MLRLDDGSVREFSELVSDAHQRDEMAAPSYLHGNPLIRWLFWRRLSEASRLLGSGPARRGLDFGCGLGLLLPTLHAQTDRVYATDLELAPVRAMVAKLRLERVVITKLGDLEAAIEPGSLDYVVATDVLEHVPDLEHTIALFARFLRRGGRLIVTGPTETRLYRLGRVLAGFAGKEHYHHTNIAHIRACITGSGAFALEDSCALPIPRLVEAFWIDRFARA